MNEMTAGEAAEILEALPNNSDEYKQYAEVNPNYILISPYCMKAIKVAASELRKIAAGEYKPVVHGSEKLISVDKVRRFLESQLSDAYYCTRVWEAWGVGTMGEDDFEPVDVEDIMNALMDGKDDSNETD